MKKLMLFLVIVLVGWNLGKGEVWSGERVEAKQPEVEVVFCLDTTGSMSGLIEGAKQKIWFIANEIVKGNPTPHLRIGLVGYRDRGDEYVTRVFPLSNDLDGVFENLMSFQAQGGGDTPEHVNKALYDALHRINWSENKETLKIIFLVGDAPPHMDYQDGFDYRKICQEAVKKDIVINTVQCGNIPSTRKFWEEIARRGEGKYARISQSGGMRVVSTPMDEELARLSSLLEESVVPYGKPEERERFLARKEMVGALSPSIAGERAAYKTRDRTLSVYDLVEAVRKNKVRLEDLKEEELLPIMRKMSLEEKRAYISQKDKEREEIKVRIEKLSKERSNYLAKRLKEVSRKDSFDQKVLEFIKEEASRKGISYP